MGKATCRAVETAEHRPETEAAQTRVNGVYGTHGAAAQVKAFVARVTRRLRPRVAETVEHKNAPGHVEAPANGVHSGPGAHVKGKVNAHPTELRATRKAAECVVLRAGAVLAQQVVLGLVGVLGVAAKAKAPACRERRPQRFRPAAIAALKRGHVPAIPDVPGPNGPPGVPVPMKVHVRPARSTWPPVETAAPRVGPALLLVSGALGTNAAAKAPVKPDLLALSPAEIAAASHDPALPLASGESGAVAEIQANALLAHPTHKPKHAVTAARAQESAPARIRVVGPTGAPGPLVTIKVYALLTP